MSEEEKTTEFLIRCGISRNLKGFRYLQTAILLVVQKPDVLNAVFSEIYSVIADEFNTTCWNVERCIRNAIKHIPRSILISLFDDCCRKKEVLHVTNSIFLALASEHIKYGGVENECKTEKSNPARLFS